MTGGPELLTARLRLRPWRDDDGPSLDAINAHLGIDVDVWWARRPAA